jgi:chromosomal replication initiator protein
MMPPPTIAAVKAAVAAEFGVPLAIMTAETRRRAAAHPRQAAMAMVDKLTGRSTTVIGRHFGGRDHTTVIFARDQVALRRARDPALDRSLRRIEALFAEPEPEPQPQLQLAFLDGPLFDLAMAPA